MLWLSTWKRRKLTPGCLPSQQIPTRVEQELGIYLQHYKFIGMEFEVSLGDAARQIENKTTDAGLTDIFPITSLCIESNATSGYNN